MHYSLMFLNEMWEKSQGLIFDPSIQEYRVGKGDIWNVFTV